MDALVMAGGRGSRMRVMYEKPTILCTVRRTVRALRDCPLIRDVAVAVTPRTPRTAHMARGHARILDTPGGGYSRDLASALDEMSGPTLVLPADMPLIDPHVLSRIIPLHDGERWDVILAPERAMNGGGPSRHTVACGGRTCRYTGISMVDASAYPTAPVAHHTLHDPRLAANLNTVRDVARLLDAAHHLPEYHCL